MWSARRTVAKRWEMKTTMRSQREIVEALEQVPLGEGIESCSGFVHDDQRSIAEESPSNRHSLPLADRELDAAGEGGGKAGVVTVRKHG